MYFLDLMITITEASFCAKDHNCQPKQQLMANMLCVQWHIG